MLMFTNTCDMFYLPVTGEFTLPLVEGLTPCVQSSDGSYVFPDVTSPDDGESTLLGKEFVVCRHHFMVIKG